MAKKEISYKQAFAEIEKILAEIENEEIDVDVLTEKIKYVATLIKICKDKLFTAEKEIEEILKNIE
jgi:exodeoxyribonuclease VII small subunit